MTSAFLLEIGTEEIPSGYLEQAADELRKMAESRLKENRIGLSAELIVYYTPRRLVLIGPEVNERQDDVTQEVTGPPKKAAYDSQGNPTKAASGFANKYDISVNDLEFVETPKGEYLFFRRTIPGRPVREVLAEIMPRLIAEIPWPKSMRWGDIGFSFVRPIHWILSLLGEEVISFEIAGIRSGSKTRGHRFMSPDEIIIKDLQHYLL